MPSDWRAQRSAPKSPCGANSGWPPACPGQGRGGVGCAQTPSSPPRGAANGMRHDGTRRPGAGGVCHPRGHRGGVGGWADTGGYRPQPRSRDMPPSLAPGDPGVLADRATRNPHPAWPDLPVDGGGRGRLSGGVCAQGFSLMARRPRGQAPGTRPTRYGGQWPGVRMPGTLVPAPLGTLPTSSPMTESTGPGPL